MVDYDAYLEDELAGKNVPAPEPPEVDPWRKEFDERFAKASLRLKKDIAELQEIEANVRSITRLQGRFETEYKIDDGLGNSSEYCWLYFYSIEWPGRHLRLQLASPHGSDKLHIGMDKPFDYPDGMSRVEAGTKAAIAALAHMAK